MKANQKVHATTQRFTQIEDIVGEVVIFSAGHAALVMEVTATNFTLQSNDEQNSKIYSYAALLNSLSFPIQILIVSRKLDISSYIKKLEVEEHRTQNQALATQINQYKEFVNKLVSVNTVLDKKFYIVIPYSFLEKGAKGVSLRDKQAFLKEARSQLMSKADSVLQELLRIGLKSKILSGHELVQLYYEIYNPETGINVTTGGKQ